MDQERQKGHEPYATLQEFYETRDFTGLLEAIVELLDLAEAFGVNLLRQEVLPLFESFRQLDQDLQVFRETPTDEQPQGVRFNRAVELLKEGSPPDEAAVGEVDPDAEWVALFQRRDQLHQDFQRAMDELEPELSELIDRVPSTTQLDEPEGPIQRYLHHLINRVPAELDARDRLEDLTQESIDFLLDKPRISPGDRVILVIVARVKQAIENFLCRDVYMRNAIHQLVDEIEDHLLGEPWLLDRLPRARQDRNYLLPHIVGTLIVSLALANARNLKRDKRLRLGRIGVLFDLGMFRLDSVWSKKGMLDQGETNLIKKHPVYSVELLKSSNHDFDSAILQAARSHHERLDGSSYPDGKEGSELGELTRLLSVSDVFMALGSNRIHREALPIYQIVQYLENAEKKFDSDVVEALYQQFGYYPPGTVVRLSNEWVAVVEAHDDEEVIVRPLIDDAGEEQPADGSDLVNLNQEPDLQVEETLGLASSVPGVCAKPLNE